jgi:hypothetical protein
MKAPYLPPRVDTSRRGAVAMAAAPCRVLNLPLPEILIESQKVQIIVETRRCQELLVTRDEPDVHEVGDESSILVRIVPGNGVAQVQANSVLQRRLVPNDRRR